VSQQGVLAQVEEATLDTREQKKDKELGHSDHPGTSKGHDKRRKVDCSVASGRVATRSTGPCQENLKVS
jgi:hypothetical protein